MQSFESIILMYRWMLEVWLYLDIFLLINEMFQAPISKGSTQISVPIHVTDHTFLTWIFFMPLWRTIKNSGRAGCGWEHRLQKMITKWKRNKNMKMASFWQYLTGQIVLTERKTSLITVFLQLLKIMAK